MTEDLVQSPVAIRDLSDRNRPPRVWLPEVNSASGGPQSHVVYGELVRHARMRLKRTEDGGAMVAVAEKGAVHLLSVPSPEFFRFCDRFRIGRRLRVLPESVLTELTRVILSRVSDPLFTDDLPLGPGDEEYGERRVSPRSPEDDSAAETENLADTLGRLKTGDPFVFVPSQLAVALSRTERQIATIFSENRPMLRKLGFDAWTVGSSLGPVYLVRRTKRPAPWEAPNEKEPGR